MSTGKYVFKAKLEHSSTWDSFFPLNYVGPISTNL